MSSYGILLNQEDCPRDTFAIGGPANRSLVLMRTLSSEQAGELAPSCIQGRAGEGSIISIKTYKCFILLDSSMGIPVLINIEPEFLVDIELMFPKTFYSGSVVEGVTNTSVNLITPEFRAQTQPIQGLVVPGYRITGQFSGMFGVTEQQAGCVSFPVIRVLEPLDREVRSYYEVTLEAYAPYTNTISTSTTVGIRVLDQNDHAPLFDDLQVTEVMINDTILPGTDLVQFRYIDIDLGRNRDIRFSLPNTTTSFTIHPLSGSIFSFKTVQSSPADISLPISAQDLGRPPMHSSNDLMVFIESADPVSPPQIGIHGLGEVTSSQQQIVIMGLTEEAALGEFVVMVDVLGQDSFGLSLSVTNVGPCECFNLTNLMPIENGFQYTLSVANFLDFESIPNGQYTVILTASESGLTTTLEFIVNITDVNEIPLFERTSYEISILEGTPVGSLVGQITATDPDEGVNGILNYSLSGPMNLLEIDPRTGQIYSAAEFNYEFSTSAQFMIRSEDGGGESAMATLVVSVLDRNNNPPIFIGSSIDRTVQISETHDPNQAIFHFVATDMDSGCNGAIEYSIIHSDPQDAFFLDSISGILYPLNSSSLDYESFQTALVIIRATDLGETVRLFSETTLSVSLSDENDEAPTIDPIGCPCFITEETPPPSPNTNCPPLSADRTGLMFEISNGNTDTLFQINSNTGEVSILSQLDREARDTYQLEITAVDGTLRSLPVFLDVIVVDINDQPPTYRESSISLVIPRDLSDGDFIADFSANQTDLGYNALTHYTFSDGVSSAVTAAFRLDPHLGVLYVSNVASLSDSQYSFDVRARDELRRELETQMRVIVTVFGLKNNPPMFELSTDHRTISENLITTGFVTQIAAIDDDSGSNGDLTYNIEESSSSNFRLTPGGILTLERSVAGMAGNVYQLNVSASDAGTSPLKAYQLLIITVYASTFGQIPLMYDVRDLVCHFSGRVTENEDATVVVATLPDMQRSSVLQYTIVNDTSAFRISSNFQLETQDGFSNIFTGREAIFITLRAEYGSNFYLCSVTVAIQDINNSPPTFDTMGPPLIFTLYNVTPIGASVYRVTASDADRGSNKIATYSISNSNELPLSINAATGDISVSGALTQLSYIFTVTASDPSFPQAQAAMTSVTALVIGVPNSPPIVSSIDTSPISIRETLRAMVTRLMTADGDGDDNPQGVNSFCIASGNRHNSFQLNRLGGELRPTGELDFESLPSTGSLDLTIMAYDSSLNPAFGSTVVRLSVQDDNEPPIFSVPVYRATITEEVSINTFVINVTASDEDTGSRGTVTYSVPNNIPFAVDSQTGSITTSGALNIANTDMYTFSVTATDGETPAASSMAEVQIVLLDVNNNPPAFTNNVDTISIPENAEIGRRITQVNATDGDRGVNALLTYAILSGENHRKFSIEPFSGFLQVAQLLDFETTPYNLMIQVCDLGIPSSRCSSTFQLTIQVLDSNDHSPVYSSTEYTCEVLENTVIFSQPCQVNAIDSDITANDVTYSIVGTSIFEIDSSSGVITIESGQMIPSLDRAIQPMYILQIEAVDSHPTEPRTSTTIVRIDIIDSNNVPDFGQTPQTYLFHEDVPINSLLFFSHAHDVDSNLNFSTVTYGISGVDTPFRVDRETGAVFLASVLDFEAITSPQAVTIIATNLNAGQVTSAPYTFSVGISDTNENTLPPVFDPDYNPSVISLSRTLSVGSLILRLNASDPEGEEVKYNILGGSGFGYFQVDQNSGEITVRFPLASITKSCLTLEIRAIDSFTHPLSSWHEIVISLMSGNSPKPFFDRPVFLANPSESAQGIVSAVSAGVNGQRDTSLCYAILTGNTGRFFSINTQTGAISLSSNGDLDRETEPVYNIIVSATKPGVSAMSVGLLVIELEDANDFRPTLTEGGTNFTVFENFPVGERVARIFAVDRDIGMNGILSYSLSSELNNLPFIISRDTGDLYLNQSLGNRTEYVVTVGARDGGLLPLDIDIRLTITISPPAVDASRPILNPIPRLHLSENTTCGTSISIVTLANPSSVANVLIYRIREEASKVSIKAGTGEIFLTSPLDHEVDTILEYTVEVLDGLNTPPERTLTIEVTDVNDNRPTFSQQNYTFTLNEAGVMTTNPVGTVEAFDGDGDTLTYSIVDSMHPSSMSLFTVGPTSGLVNPSGVIDREELPSHTLTIEVTDGRFVDRATVTITVTDSDDNRPLFHPASIEIFVREDLPLEEVIYKVLAFDPDEGTNAEINYDLLTSNTPFSINSTTGEIRLSSALDAEIQQTYNLEVRAFNPNNPLSSFSPANLNVTVSILDVLDSIPVLTSQTPATIRENYPPYSYVTRIESSSTSRQIYCSIIEGNGLGHFMVEPLTGVLRTTVPLDRERVSLYQLIVQGAYETDFFGNISILVTVTDANDEKPRFPSPFLTIEIPEHSPTQTPLANFSVEDPDEGENGRIASFIIMDSLAADVFSIDTSGNIILKQGRRLDRQDEFSSLTFRAIAVDSGTPMQYSSTQIHIIITDANDPPRFEEPEYIISLSTPVVLGTSQFRVQAVDTDSGNNGELTYSISGNTDIFSIDNRSGNISITDNYMLQDQYLLELVATDGGGLAASTNLTILVRPCNFRNLTFGRGSSMISVSLSEDTISGFTVVSSAELQVTDHNLQDNAPANVEFSFSIPDPSFNIDPQSGEITLVSLDRERQQIHKLVVQATDQSDSNRVVQAQVLVTVLDVNDNPPEFPFLTYSFDFSNENPEPQRVVANDIDEGPNAMITYSLTTNPSNSFRIDENTGIITLIAIPDTTPLQLVITATDGGSSPLSTSVEVNVFIVDSMAPVFSQSIYPITITENTTTNTILANLSLAESSQDRQVSFRFGQGTDSGIPFSLSNDGVVTLVDPGVDYEIPAQRNYTLTLTAQDTTSGSIGFALLIVQVLDSNDETPAFQSNGFYNIDVPEDTAMGAIILQVMATDDDSSSNALLSYGLESSVELFFIASSTGNISLSGELDYEQFSRHQFEVYAEDMGSPSLTGTATVIVQVTNINDNPPVFREESYRTTIRDNEQPGPTNLFVSATDSDNLDVLQYDIVPGPNSEAFDILENGRLNLNIANPNETSYTLNISAFDGNFFGYASVVVSVEGVNSHIPMFSNDTYRASVLEGVAPGVFVIQVTATDMDTGRNGLVMYFLQETESRFVIDRMNGTISTASGASGINREAMSTIALLVTAMDGGSFTNSADLILTVEDVNDNRPVFNSRFYVGTIMDGAPTGTEVLTVTASDSDSGDNGTLTYSIEEQAQLIFRINSESGLITNFIAPSFMVISQYNFIVSVRDNGLPSLNGTTTANVTISIIQGDLPPSFEEDRYEITVLENATIGTPVLEVRFNTNTTSQCDFIGPITLTSHQEFILVGNSILTSVPQLELNNTTLVLSSTCTVFDPQQVTHFTASVGIVVLDINDPPRFINSNGGLYSGSVAENSTNNAIVQLNPPISAVDEENGMITYRLLDHMDIFEITPGTGTLLTRVPLDYETPPTFIVVTVEARDDGMPPMAATVFVRIQVNDRNDNPPVFNQTSYSFSVPENTTVGTRLGTPSVMDVDTDSEFNFIISGSIFEINRRSGEITLALTLDREMQSNHSAVIVVDDGIHSASANLIVIVTDSNDQAPVFDQLQYEVTIAENYPVGQSFIRVFATDEDEGDNGIVVYQQLTASTNRTVLVNSSTGDVSFLVSPDYEADPQMNLIIRATDIFGELRSSATIIIRLTDENDNAPMFVLSTYEAHINENLPDGSNVIIEGESRVEAVDGDSEENGTLNYSIEGPGAEFFSISNGGDIVSNVSFDRERDSSYEILVVARDMGSPSKSGNATVLVQILDQNDNDPMFPFPQYTLSISESRTVNSVIFSERIVDLDAGENGAILQYLITGINSDDFQPEDVDGNITISIAAPLDHENELGREYNLTMIAIDNGFRQGLASLIINVIDFDEHDPVFSQNPYSASIMENATTGASITTVSATDRDASQSLFYSILNEGNHPEFRINEITGEIVVVSGLDRETTSSYTLTVVVANERDTLGAITTRVLITVTDVNDNAPEFDQNTLVYYSQEENNADIVLLASFQASDRDQNPENVPITYGIAEEGNIGGDFQINPTNGEVVIQAEVLDRERVAVYYLTITAQDGVPPFLIGTINITVNVIDVDDSAPTNGHQNIYLYLLNGMVPSTSLGRVFINDSDVNNTLTYSLHDPNREETTVRINSNTGAIVINSNLPGEGTYSFLVNISNLNYGPVTTTVSLLIRNVSESALLNSFSMQFTAVTPEDFVDGHLESFRSALLSLVNQLSGSFDIQVLSIQPSVSPSLGHTDVTLAIHNTTDNSYITPLIVQHIMHVNRNELETASGLTIFSESVDLCSRERCNVTSACTNSYQESPNNISLGSLSTTYFGISVVHSYACESIATSPCDDIICPQPSYCVLKKTHRNEYEAECLDDCSSNPCRNAGKCLVQNPGYYCQCPDGYDGRNCELSVAGFHGTSSYVVFPALESRSSGNITFDFNADRVGNSLLLYSGRFDTMEARDSLYVELLDSYACLRISYGGGDTDPRPACIKVRSWSSLGDGLWNSLTIQYNTTVSK